MINKKNIGATFRGNKLSYTLIKAFTDQSSFSVNLSNFTSKKEAKSDCQQYPALNNKPAIPIKFLSLHDISYTSELIEKTPLSSSNLETAGNQKNVKVASFHVSTLQSFP